MLDSLAAVVVYDNNSGDAGYITIAHNISKYDAERLAERLVTQYELDAHVIYHRITHESKDATECEQCMLLFEEIIERSVKLTAGITIPDATGDSR